MEDRIVRAGILKTLIFILGFTVIFVMLGAGASSLSGFLAKHMRLITIIGGAIIIVLAVQVMGLFTIPFLNYERRANFQKKPQGIIGSFLRKKPWFWS